MILNSPYISGSLTVTNLSGSGVRYLMTSASGLLISQTADAAIKNTYTASATAGQTVFPVTNGYSTGLVDVYLNGTKLASSDYSDADGLNITLVTGSDAGDLLEFVKYSPALGVTNNALRQLTTFTSSEGQTVYSASYTPGLLDVYYNGSRLTPAEYTANNGTFITLATGSTAGDIIDMLVYSYQVGAFTGVGGGGVANHIAFYNTTSSISGSNFLTVSGSNVVVTGSLLISSSLTPLNINNNALFVSSSGFVGLSTTQSFNSTLTVAPLKTPGVALQVIADSDGRTFSLYTSDYISLVSGSTLRMGFVTGSKNTNAVIQAYTAGELNTGSLILQNGGGSVGIGTSSPSGQFHVQATNSGIVFDTTTAYTPVIKAAGILSDIQIQSVGNGGNIYLYAPGNPSIITMSTNATERMRIASGGNVSMNTTTTGATLNLKAQSGGNIIKFINNSGGDGTIFAYGTSTSLEYAFNTYSVGNAFYLYNNGNYDFAGSDVSDIRLKENITTIELNATEKLMQLVPKSYNMIKHPDIKRSGFIAQEVKEIIPDFVTGEETEEDYLGIDYNGILALTVKALQEANAKITALEEKLERNNIQ